MLHPNRYIDYTYGADGSLLRKRQYDNGTLQKTTDYIDGFQYENNTLVYFPMPEGRVLVSDSTYTQEFVLTDQQGNARLSFQNNAGTAKAMQENSYYGFGMTMTSAMGVPGTPNKRLYNGGSEWQNDYSNNPDYYQTFYRNYDAALGRFVAVDPKAEATGSLSVYHYAGNNPVMMNDPMGDKMAYNTDPFSPGFNSQVGNVWTESGTTTGFTPNYSGPGGGAALLDYNLAFMAKEAKNRGESTDDYPSDVVESLMKTIPGALFWNNVVMAALAIGKDRVDFNKNNINSIYNNWSSLQEGDVFNFTADENGTVSMNTYRISASNSSNPLDGMSINVLDGSSATNFLSKGYASSKNASMALPYIVSVIAPYLEVNGEIVQLHKPYGVILPTQWFNKSGQLIKATVFDFHYDPYPNTLPEPVVTVRIAYNLVFRYPSGRTVQYEKFTQVTITAGGL